MWECLTDLSGLVNCVHAEAGPVRWQRGDCINQDPVIDNQGCEPMEMAGCVQQGHTPLQSVWQEMNQDRHSMSPRAKTRRGFVVAAQNKN